ncbi:hypothetical protein RF11_09716 [Thelohanellus kitauei]|uniref:Uncharacterized protein n=1 Tax=Thelohanellus kitauei TaxID=669202 RepID=A0A0C2NEM8_THEKT|nr:hypothetical protein RF11_09716 [Thelohanellus kitauei]
MELGTFIQTVQAWIKNLLALVSNHQNLEKYLKQNLKSGKVEILITGNSAPIILKENLSLPAFFGLFRIALFAAVDFISGYCNQLKYQENIHSNKLICYVQNKHGLMNRLILSFFKANRACLDEETNFLMDIRDKKSFMLSHFPVQNYECNALEARFVYARTLILTDFYGD